MPQITTIRVVRKRSVQPEQFGNATAEVELVGNVLEGEDPVKVARQMLVDSRSLVYENLGLKLPASAVKAAEEVDTPTEKAEVKTETKTEEKEETKKRGPGRPKGSKNTAPRKPAAKKDDDELPSDDDELPSDDDEPNIRTNPEDRKNPEDDDELPSDDGEEDTGEFTAEDLHKFINDNIKAGKLTVQQAKQMQREMKVARVRDLDTPEKVAMAHTMIESFIKANEAK